MSEFWDRVAIDLPQIEHFLLNYMAPFTVPPHCHALALRTRKHYMEIELCLHLKT